MKGLWAVGALALTLSGCATEGKYQEVLKTWVGMDEVKLIRSWGPPQSTYESGGTKFLIYSTQRTAYVPGIAPTYTTSFVGNTAYTNSYGGTQGFNVQMSCTTTFEVVGGIISSWSYQGNACKSR